MVAVKQEKKKKKDKKSLGEMTPEVKEMTFKIEPSEAKIEPIDTSQWPLLLKVRVALGDGPPWP